MFFDLSENTSVKLRHDVQKLLELGSLQSQLQVGAEKTEALSAQIKDRLGLTGEYRHQGITGKKESFQSQTNVESDILAARADYQLTDKTGVFLEQQATVKGSPDHQTTTGIHMRINEYFTTMVEETVGTRKCHLFRCRD